MNKIYTVLAEVQVLNVYGRIHICNLYCIEGWECSSFQISSFPLFKFPFFMAKISKTYCSIFCMKVTNMMRSWNG